MSNSQQLTTAGAICIFMYAGNATVTLRSAKTGKRYTYQVRESDDGRVFFVGVMYGPDNTGDFAYLGTIRDGVFQHGRKSKIGVDDPRTRGFAYFCAGIQHNIVPAHLEVYHEGRCGACGRKLTVPESILTGLGPECSAKRGIARVKCDDPLADVMPAVDNTALKRVGGGGVGGTLSEGAAA